MKADNPIKRGIDAALKDAVFSKKGDTWLGEREETVLLVRLQKSNFGEQYYIGLGVYLRDLAGPEVNPSALREPLCHVRARADAIGDSKPEWKSVLDIEDASLTPTERQSKTEVLMRRIALPWLRICSTKGELRVAQREGQLKPALVDKRVVAALT